MNQSPHFRYHSLPTSRVPEVMDHKCPSQAIQPLQLWRLTKIASKSSSNPCLKAHPLHPWRTLDEKWVLLKHLETKRPVAEQWIMVEICGRHDLQFQHASNQSVNWTMVLHCSKTFLQQIWVDICQCVPKSVRYVYHEMKLCSSCTLLIWCAMVNTICDMYKFHTSE